MDPESGKATTFYDPKQAYIWALRFSGSDLIAATGVEGKLFRVTPAGEGKVWFDSAETHLRSMAPRSDGTMLVGASGKGRIYAVRPDGSAHALYDSTLSEISSIYVDPSGTGWAAGVSNVLPSSAPKTPATKAPQQQGGSSAAQTEGRKEDAPPAAEVSFSFDDGPGAASAQAGAGELYRINNDGFVESRTEPSRPALNA